MKIEKALIITNQKIGHNEFKIPRFIEEGEKLGIEFDVKKNDGILVFIDEFGRGKTTLDKYKFVIYLDKDYYAAKILESLGYKLFNSADFIRVCDDKILTYLYGLNNGIDMIKTIPCPLVFSKELNEDNFSFLKNAEKLFSYPYIFKRVYSSLGEGVYLVNNLDEAKKLYSSYYKETTLLQEYLEECKGSSIRVIVIDKKIFGAYNRYCDNDFRSNYQSSAGGRKYNLSKKDVALINKIIDVYDIYYAGIDLLIKKNGNPVLCEINSNAFFFEFEKVTGLNVAKAFLKMCIKYS